MNEVQQKITGSMGNSTREDTCFLQGEGHEGRRTRYGQSVSSPIITWMEAGFTLQLLQAGEDFPGFSAQRWLQTDGEGFLQRLPATGKILGLKLGHA